MRASMSRPQLCMRKRLADEVNGAQVRHHTDSHEGRPDI
jgi:hypothetical protein